MTIKRQQPLSRNIAKQKQVDKAQRKLFSQKKSVLISVTDSSSENSDALEFSLIMDTVDPSSTTTESLARIHEFTAPAVAFDYATLKPSTLSSG